MLTSPKSLILPCNCIVNSVDFSGGATCCVYGLNLYIMSAYISVLIYSNKTHTLFIGQLRDCSLLQQRGARGGLVVKALRYKPAGWGFDSRWCHWNFSVT
jgi:hypothetical protein